MTPTSISESGDYPATGACGAAACNNSGVSTPKLTTALSPVIRIVRRTRLARRRRSWPRLAPYQGCTLGAAKASFRTRRQAASPSSLAPKPAVEIWRACAREASNIDGFVLDDAARRAACAAKKP